MKRERFEERLIRVFREAGYPIWEILTVTPEEMVKIKGITVPDIRAVLYVQGRLRIEQNGILRMAEALRRAAAEEQR